MEPISPGDAMTASHMSSRRWAWSVETELGRFRALFTPTGLCALRWDEDDNGDENASPPTTAPETVAAMARALARELADYAGGAPVDFQTPLDFSDGTPFRRTVWQCLTRTPWGCTTTYGEVAARIGSPGAARAVGGACGANPVPIVAPCHRVLASGGRIGGFSGGLARKRRLLRLEGIPLRS